MHATRTRHFYQVGPMMSRDAVRAPIVGRRSRDAELLRNEPAPAQRGNDAIDDHAACYDHRSGVASQTDNPVLSFALDTNVHEQPHDVYTRGVGLRIRAVREELEMGINELAKSIGVERRRLANWEHGRHMPNDERAMLLLCLMSDVTLDWIYRASVAGMPRLLGLRLASRVAGELPPPRSR